MVVRSGQRVCVRGLKTGRGEGALDLKIWVLAADLAS